MKNLFVIALAVVSLGGCAAMNQHNSYRSDSNAAEYEASPMDLASVQYLHSLGRDNSVEENSAEQEAPAEAVQVASKPHEQSSSFFYWNEDGGKVN